MKSYYQSQPDKRGFRKRLLTIWKENKMFTATEQRLCDQVRTILKRGWLSELQLEELRRTATENKIRTSNSEIKQQAQESLEHDNKENQDKNKVSDPQIKSKNTSKTPVPDKPNTMDEGRNDIVEELNRLMKEDELPKPQTLRNIDRARVKDKAQLVNNVISKVRTNSISEINKLIICGALVTCKLLGMKDLQKKQQEPHWKRRIEQKINSLRKDVSLIVRWKNGSLSKGTQKERLDRMYQVKKKGFKRVAEELKQRITAKAATVKRYTDRVSQYKQNRLFQSNQAKFYEELDGSHREQNINPDRTQIKNFWEDIWGKDVSHNKDAEWIKELAEEGEPVKQQDIKISTEKVKSRISRMGNWKAPGLDGVQGYWLKSFKSLHTGIAEHLEKCMTEGDVPKWMTTGRTVLIMKDKTKGNINSNYRPITCLPLMWKILTGIIADEIYSHLDTNRILPVEQKGCRKSKRGSKDQLMIDKAIMRNSKRRKVGLSMVWIDYRKAYDMLPHSWIIKTLELYGIAENIVKLIAESMKGWQTMLTAGSEELAKVNIKRGIFQGDSLSPLLFIIGLIPLSSILQKDPAGYQFNSKVKVNHLLFMDDLKIYGRNEAETERLTNTVNIFTRDIGMEFGIDKCAHATMKRGKLSSVGEMELTSGEIIREIESEKGYKYLGILEADDIKHSTIKANISREYYRRLRKIISSKLNGGNTIKAINSRAVSLVRYGAGILNWTKEELRCMDRKTRKIMTMNRMYHPQSDVHRLYLPRKEGGRGLLSIQDCVENEENSLSIYAASSTEWLLKEVVKEKILPPIRGSTAALKKQQMGERHAQWQEKQLHGKFLRDTEEVRGADSWRWNKKGFLKKETEGLIFAAQDQALRTNWIKKHIDKREVTDKCRMCGGRDESVDHLIAECEKMAQKQYKQRHDNIARIVHLELCQKFGLIGKMKWYNHKPEDVMENDRVKILWDFNIQTDHVIQHRRPDIVIVYKNERRCHIVDVAVPGDKRVEQKEQEKIEKYGDLRREIKKIWKLKYVGVIPIVVGALGIVSNNLKDWLEKMDLKVDLEILQKAALLGTAKLLRNVLET